MSRRHLLFGTIACLGVLSSVTWFVAIRKADREYAAYEALRAMGAAGDDWVSVGELVTGRPPIVQVDLPATAPRHAAFQLLPDLHNLETLGLSYDNVIDAELNTIRRLQLESLDFDGDYPTDANVEQLAGLSGLRFLYLCAGNLSEQSLNRLQLLLPSTKISVR